MFNNNPFNLNVIVLNNSKKQIFSFDKKKEFESYIEKELNNNDLIVLPKLSIVNNKEDIIYKSPKILTDGDLFVLKNYKNEINELWMFEINEDSFGFRLISKIGNKDFKDYLIFKDFFDKKKGIEIVYHGNISLFSFVEFRNIFGNFNLSTDMHYRIEILTNQKYFNYDIFLENKMISLSSEMSNIDLIDLMSVILEKEFSLKMKIYTQYIFNLTEKNQNANLIEFECYTNSVFSLNEKYKEKTEEVKNSFIEFVSNVLLNKKSKEDIDKMINFVELIFEIQKLFLVFLDVDGYLKVKKNNGDIYLLKDVLVFFVNDKNSLKEFYKDLNNDCFVNKYLNFI